MSRKRSTGTKRAKTDDRTARERFNTLFLSPEDLARAEVLPDATKRKYQNISFLLSLVLVSSFGGFLYTNTDMYFHDGWAMLTFGSGGLIVGLIASLTIKRFAPSFASFQWNGGAATAWILLLGLFTGPGFGVLLNHFGPSPSLDSFKITEFYYKEKGRRYVRLQADDGATVQCWFGETFNSTHAVGQRVTLPVHQGLLGFDFVTAK